MLDRDCDFTLVSKRVLCNLFNIFSTQVLAGPGDERGPLGIAPVGHGRCINKNCIYKINNKCNEYTDQQKSDNQY